MKFKLLIFDLDGTIADTVYSIRDGVNLTVKKYGFPERNYEQIRDAIGNGARELIRLSLPIDRQGDDNLIDAALADYNVFYGQTYDRVHGCYEGMESALRKLKDRGYTLAVLSNKQDEYVKKIMISLFEDDFFVDVRGQTSLPRKPDPTVPLIMAERLGFQPCECAFIGDSDVDIRTGKNAGMTAVGCSWGYRPRALLGETGADFIVDIPAQLLDIFK